MDEYILKALFSQVGITGTFSVLLDVGQLQGPIIFKQFKAKTGI